MTDELGDSLNEYDVIAGYNNYYEFSMDKEAVANCRRLRPRPGNKVGGLVENPTTYSIDDILRAYPRGAHLPLRCVEAWSMVIPGGLPTCAAGGGKTHSRAKYVKFTVYRPEAMPGQQRSTLNWPYIEGLRLDRP